MGCSIQRGRGFLLSTVQTIPKVTTWMIGNFSDRNLHSNTVVRDQRSCPKTVGTIDMIWFLFLQNLIFLWKHQLSFVEGGENAKNVQKWEFYGRITPRAKSYGRFMRRQSKKKSIGSKNSTTLKRNRSSTTGNIPVVPCWSDEVLE